MSSTAIAASAVAISAANSARISEMKREQCKVTMPAFNAQIATATEARAYAECVESVYPNPMSPDTVLAIKVAIVLLFLGVIGGAIWGAINSWFGRVESILFGAFNGFLAVVCSLTVLAGAAAGIRYLIVA